jgi:hypothetical protein
LAIGDNSGTFSLLNGKYYCVMQDMLPILAELRRAVDMQMELDSLVEKENYFQVSHFIDCTLTKIATAFDMVDLSC